MDRQNPDPSAESPGLAMPADTAADGEPADWDSFFPPVPDAVVKVPICDLCGKPIVPTDEDLDLCDTCLHGRRWPVGAGGTEADIPF